MDVPEISDDEIVAAVRERRGDPALDVRVRKRRRLKPTQGLTGSYFERVSLTIGGEQVKAILKLGEFPYGPQPRERLFFAELAREVPAGVPAAYGVGAPRDGGDGWVLMQALPKGLRIIDWTPEDSLDALRNLATLHAAYMGRAPQSLPRPFTRDIDYTLSFIEGGVREARAKYEAFPHFPRAISERALDLVLELSRRPEIFRVPFDRSPETLLHGDYHRGNLVVRRGEPQVMFDWQFVCAGPPAYDLAVFWLYMGAVNKRGFFGFFDRMQLMDRPMTWQQVLDTYTAALRERCPDADIDGIVACAEEALAWEIIRQVTYFGHGLDNFGGYLRFIYRDHRTIGGWFAKWVGITEGWRMFADIFADFEQRAERLLSR